ncbi:MAG: universal stress protein [Elainellaceae cyanobacterium]
MFRRILAALDHSDRDPAVYEKGRELAQALSAELLLLHVLDFHEADSPELPSSVGMEYSPDVYREAMDLYWQQQRDYEQQQLQRLRAQADGAIAQGIEASVALVKGNAGPSICCQAKAWRADLIIVGCRGRSSLQELLLGSVSQYVNHHAACSVLIVHPQPETVKQSEAVAAAHAS